MTYSLITSCLLALNNHKLSTGAHYTFSYRSKNIIHFYLEDIPSSITFDVNEYKFLGPCAKPRILTSLNDYFNKHCLDLKFDLL